MSSQPIANAIAAVREAAAGAAWTQWGAILTSAVGRRPARAIVDPEALLLASLVLSGHEPRLWRVARLWARYGARLLSVQRLKNLVHRFPDSVAEQLGEFARLAVADGGDLRWRSFAADSPQTKPSVGRREPQANPVLQGGPALMLRLRLGFGVGIKPDVVSNLIGLAGGGATVQQIAGASEARDLTLEHATTLESAGVRLSSLKVLRGEAYLEPFGKALRDLAHFLDSVV